MTRGLMETVLSLTASSLGMTGVIDRADRVRDVFFEDDFLPQPRPRRLARPLLPDGPVEHVQTDRPLTKRAKRRLRGKAKGSSS